MSTNNIVSTHILQSNSNSIYKKDNRLGYIDAMRGFSMILVVFEHVLLLMGIPTTVTPLGAVFTTFRMPLFFFVSGYFAYKASNSWNKNKIGRILKKKIQAQIIGTIFFYSLFHLCFHNDIIGWIYEGFGWFWFTIVLFQMYLVYLAISLLEKKFKLNFIVDATLAVLSTVLFIIYVKGTQIDFRIWKVLSWFNLCCYFQFFTFGILAKKYINTFIYIISNKYIRATVIVSFIIFLILTFGLNNSLANYSSTLGNISEMLIVRYLGLLTIFIFFYSYRSIFDGDSKIVSSLRIIGTRTLDIYMLHMFFVPDLKFIGTYFYHGGNLVIIQLVTVVLISIAVVGVCLIISMLLRSSTILSEWLFGTVKKNAK